MLPSSYCWYRKGEQVTGNWVSYDVNGANRIGKVRKGETGASYYMQSAVYNPAGALTSATLGLDGANQWTETRAYNSRLQARRVEVTKGANTLLRLRWAYSGAYNSTTLEETGTDNNGDPRVERLEFPHQGTMQSLDRTYAYTGADRLVSFTEPSKSQSFTYDAFGNVWQHGGVGVPSLRQTGSSWYLQSNGVVNNRLANTTYDAAGNQTQLLVAAGTVASYDGENRMSKIAAGGSEKALYTYDAEGRRVAKTVSGATTYYFYDAAGQLMAEYGGPTQAAGTQYYTTDYLGSTRLILNGTGGCLNRLDYAPFGGQISRSYDCYSGASSEKPLFTGQMRDGESNAGTDTGQDYFNARYFWGNTARFTSPDAPFADQQPEDGQSWNLYAYVRNNPLRWVDPGGRCFVDPETDSSVDDEGNACFEVDAPSDRPLPTEVSRAFASIARNAGPVVEAAAIGTVVVPSLAIGSAALISALTPAATATVGTVGAASQTPSGQQLLSSTSTFATNAIRWGPATGRGPLSEAVVATFRGGSYTESVTQEATVLYRAYGGSAGQLSPYWSRIAPSGPLQARIDSALLPQWGNTAESVAKIVVPRGSTIYEGFAAGQGSLVGGGSQVFLPKVNPRWLIT